MSDKKDSKDCIHSWHIHPGDPSKRVCHYCGAEEAPPPKPKDEAEP